MRKRAIAALLAACAGCGGGGGGPNTAGLLFAPAAPLVPHARIATTDPFEPDFLRAVIVDPEGDVAAGEIDMTSFLTGQTDTALVFQIGLVSTVVQALLRDDMRYSIVFSDVAIDGQEGTFWIQTNGASPSAGIAFFEPTGMPPVQLSTPVGVAAETGIVVLWIPLDAFAFSVLGSASRDFEVWPVVERFDMSAVAAVDSADPRVVRYGDGAASEGILSQQHYCGFFNTAGDPVYVSGFTVTYYNEDPFTPVVEDDWGLVQTGQQAAIDWVADWEAWGGDVGVCPIPARPAPSVVTGVWWLDLKDGQEVFVSDLDAFIATHF